MYANMYYPGWCTYGWICLLLILSPPALHDEEAGLVFYPWASHACANGAFAIIDIRERNWNPPPLVRSRINAGAASPVRQIAPRWEHWGGREARGSLGRQPAAVTSVLSILGSRERDGNPASDRSLAPLLSGGNKGWGEDRAVVTGIRSLLSWHSVLGLKLNWGSGENVSLWKHWRAPEALEFS